MSEGLSVRLVQCDPRGDPVEPTPALPETLQDNCRKTAQLFASIGFHPPWVGYIAVAGPAAVGGCAFIGAPKDGAVEIAYFTLEGHENRGIATQTVARMIEIARRADPGVTLTAKTLPAENPSTSVLRRSGFAFCGETTDDDIGLAWAWRLPPA